MLHLRPPVIRVSPEYDPSAVSIPLGIPESVTPSAGAQPLSCRLHFVFATLSTIAQIGLFVKKYLGLENFFWESTIYQRYTAGKVLTIVMQMTNRFCPGSERGMPMNEIEEFIRELGLRIAFCRKERGLTQKELAQRLGVSRTHISNIEASQMHTSLSMALLLRICLELQIRPEDMMRLEASDRFVP